jgi:ribosomal protein L7/L12
MAVPARVRAGDIGIGQRCRRRSCGVTRNAQVAHGWLDESMSTFEVTLLVIATVGSIAAAAGAWASERRSSAIQLAALQRKLDLVVEHLGIAAPEEAEVVRHLENGRTIEAVRTYRKQTGLSLVEAKQAVDRLAARRRLTDE